MRTVLRTLIASLLLISLFTSSASAEGKIATIDLKKVFEKYWKKQQAEAALKERGASMEKEYKNMLDDYKKAKEDFTALQSSASDTSISPEERDKRKKSAEDKLKQLRDMEDTIGQYERQSKATLAEQGNRMRTNLLKEIQDVVSGKARASGFSFVIDTAAEAATGTPIILFTNNENDITDAVLLQLNANAPTEPTRPDDKKGSLDSSGKK